MAADMGERALVHELEQTRARLGRMTEENAALALALEAAEADAAEFERREHEFEEARRTFYELDVVRGQLDAMRSQIDLARGQVEFARNQLQDIEGSLSWRVTRPIRLLSQKLRLRQLFWR